jgi:hypothetical protein
LAWALLNMNAAIKEALDDIHSHVREQSQTQTSVPPVPLRVSR